MPDRQHYGKPKTKTAFQVYVEQHERDLIDRAARALGQTRGAYCRATVLRDARTVCSDSVQTPRDIPLPTGRATATPNKPTANPERSLGANVTASLPPSPPPTLTPEERAERRRRLTAPRRPDVILAPDGRRESDGMDEPPGEPYNPE